MFARQIAAQPGLPYLAPFIAFVGLLALGSYIPAAVDAPLRLVVLAAVLWFFSRDVFDFKAAFLVPSTLLGVLVFFIWIAPDVLVPHYRDYWLFQNGITGTLHLSIPSTVLETRWILACRIARSVLLVPVIEELFWRAWLMRWLISPRFEKIPLGAYAPVSFWVTAVLFAAEHGPYWDVGLITGVIYNWWMVRTRSLGDCIMVHAVTNACLAGYIVATHHWEYWL